MVLQQWSKCAEVIPVETNIVIWKPAAMGSAAMVEWLSERGVRCFPFGPEYVRFVFHRDITEQHMLRLFDIVKD